MKNKGLIISLIVVLSIISITLIGGMIFLISGKGKLNFGSYKTSNELVVNEMYDTYFDGININSSASDIEIKKSNNDNFQVIIYGDEADINVETKNNILKVVVDEDPCIGFCFNIKISKIEIYVPKFYNKEITITNLYGDVKVTELLNANINIETDASDITVLGTNNLVIKNKYGDITVNKANKLNIEEDCGDVKVGIINEITVNNNLGDIEINEVNKYLNIENDCGDIKIDNIILTKDSYIKDNLGDIELGSTNEIFIDAKASLGKVKINNNYNKSDISLKIDNDCGDIKVKN